MQENNKKNESLKNNLFSQKNYIDFIYSTNYRPKSDYPLKLANHLLKRFYIKKGSLVDLGCGRGDMLKAFSQIGLDVQGVDLSPSSLELNKPIPVKLSDLSKDELPYKSESFDYVFSKSVIEHIEEPSLLIKESFRILRPKGKCIFLTPSWLHNSWGPFYLDHTHVTPFTQFSLKNILKMSGYENVKVLNFRQLPFVWRFPILKIFPKIIAKMPLRYSPMYDVKLPNSLNKLIRFSNEVMLLAYGEKL